MTTSRVHKFSRSGLRAVTTATGLGLLASLAFAGTAEGVNTSHGDGVVSSSPVRGTPHVMDGSVNAIVQVGDMVVAAGDFTSVSPATTFTDVSDDLVRRSIFAFSATTGTIDPNFNPDLSGPARSLTTDGTSIYVGGSFGSVGGVTTRKRVAKLSLSGVVDTTFRVVPSAAVNEVVYDAASSRLYIGGDFITVKRGQVTESRRRLAALNPVTGAVLPEVNVPFEGVYNAALYSTPPSPDTATAITRFDISPDGRKLVAVGNFDTVGGQPRSQVVVLDLDPTGSGTSVAPWFTNRFDKSRNNCARVFKTFTRDVDISPDGSFFVITTTGAFAGGAGSGTLCDTSSRWEMRSLGNDPTWINYTGGDTSYGVAVTGDVVYVGGHFRWQNNPFQGDQAGPGAVPRDGLAALDAMNGLPLSWNPGRERGVGAQALHATPQGLWVGSDTTLLSGQRRGRVAFMPLAGGSQIADVVPATLPNTVFMVGANAGTAMLSRPLGATGAPTAAATTANGADNWSSVRGALYINGDLFYGLSDGSLAVRSFDPATGVAGEQQTVDLHNDPDNGARTWGNLANVTGMFFDPATHRLYYTVSGSSGLFYRYFTPESRVVGAQQFAADTGGVSFANTAGMTLAGGRVLFGTSSKTGNVSAGMLRSATFDGGRITSGATVVSDDGSWRHTGMFLPNG